MPTRVGAPWTSTQRFENRHAAGQALASLLSVRPDLSDAVVVGLPRGGVPVAFEIATRLGVPLDVLVVRKLGVPGQPELAFGAIASGGYSFVDREIAAAARLASDTIEAVAREQWSELARREAGLRGLRPALDVNGRKVILVDDGIATGSTARVAIRALRAAGAQSIVVAVPVVDADVARSLAADEVIALIVPDNLIAISRWYRVFDQTTDREVAALLEAAGAQFDSAG